MTLEETMLNQELGSVDLSKITALQQKRTVAFINHFLLTSIQFLNNFMKECEQKLMLFERKLNKVNAAMVLLEARLSSIPELDTPVDTTQQNVPDSKLLEEIVESPKEDIVPVDTSAVTSEIVQTKQARPEYDRFVKMVQVGVPMQAVKLKVSLEGLDPNILEEIMSK